MFGSDADKDQMNAEKTELNRIVIIIPDTVKYISNINKTNFS